MQAATCATSLTPGTRSSRAISEACSEAGTAAPAPAVPASSTALVSSSTNSGTPSVRAAISPSTSGGRPRPPARRATIASVGPRPRRLSVSRVTCGCPPRVGWLSGRLVSSISTRAPAIRSRAWPDQLEGGGVDPVRVLEHHQHRPAAREPEELLDQHGQRAGAPLLRGEVRRRVARARVDPEQRRDQRRRLADVLRPLAQQRLELVELRRLGVGGLEAGGEAELLGHRPERRAGVVGRALVAERRVLLARDRVEHGPDQPGLADAGLADQEHRLALAGRGLPPALEHERQLLVAPDHGRRPARPPGLEAAAGGALAERPGSRSPGGRSP